VSERWPLVSIVFVSYNRREQLSVSLDQVLNHLDYPGDRLETIVVDNASEDGTVEMLRDDYRQVQLIRNPVNIGASAWNIGMSTARGEWRLILDDDCYITGDALKTAIRNAEMHRADLVSFLVASSEDPGFFNDGTRSPGLLGFVGCSALFSRRAIETEPFYDPHLFIWGNELELTIRLLDRGLRHLYLPEVVSVHQKAIPAPTLSIRFATINQRHWAYSAGKLLQPGDALVVLARLVLRTLVDAARSDKRLLRTIPTTLAGFVDGLRRRRPVRPAVSSVYRCACVDFSNPLVFLRTPWQRLSGLIDPDRADRARDARRARWNAVAGRYYPPERAVLEV
jgi:GT2 family glycosyltransferase